MEETWQHWRWNSSLLEEGHAAQPAARGVTAEPVTTGSAAAEAERAHAAVAAAAARGTWRQSLPRREQLPPSRLTRTTGWSLLHGHGDMVCLQPPARLHMGKQREHTQDTRPDSGCNVMYKYENETQVVTANITARTKRTLYTIRVIGLMNG